MRIFLLSTGLGIPSPCRRVGSRLFCAVLCLAASLPIACGQELGGELPPPAVRMDILTDTEWQRVDRSVQRGLAWLGS